MFFQDHMSRGVYVWHMQYKHVCIWLTCVVETAVGERQQWGVEGVLRVPQDGIMLIDVLHNLWIEFILLYKNNAHKHM